MTHRKTSAGYYRRVDCTLRRFMRLLTAIASPALRAACGVDCVRLPESPPQRRSHASVLENHVTTVAACAMLGCAGWCWDSELAARCAPRLLRVTASSLRSREWHSSSLAPQARCTNRHTETQLAHMCCLGSVHTCTQHARGGRSHAPTPCLLPGVHSCAGQAQGGAITLRRGEWTAPCC